MTQDDDECYRSEGCVFDEACPFHGSCSGARRLDHEEGNCAGWNPPCPDHVDQEW